MNVQTLQTVETFPYFTLSRYATINTEINNRISKASSAFGTLRKNLWEGRGISLTKLKVYQAVVLTTLLYGYKTHERRSGNLLHIRWQDKVPDMEVLKKADIPSSITIMRKAQLRWAGHVSCMSENGIPKQLFCGEVPRGKRKVRGKKKFFKDKLKVYMEAWETLAADRPSWHSAITTVAQRADVEGQSDEHQHDNLFPLLSYLWERLPYLGWPHQPPPH